MTRPIITYNNPRWNGDTRNPASTPSQSGSSLVKDGKYGEFASRAERLAATDRRRFSSSRSFSEKSPSNSSAKEYNWNGARYSDPGVSEERVRLLPSQDAKLRSAGGAATTRGKRLLRERLKLKAKKDRLLQQHGLKSEDQSKTVSQKPNLETSSSLLDQSEAAQHLGTPVTAASSTTDMSRSLSLRQAVAVSMASQSQTVLANVAEKNSPSERRMRRRSFSGSRRSEATTPAQSPPTRKASVLRSSSLLDTSETMAAIMASNKGTSKAPIRSSRSSPEDSSSQSDEEREKQDATGHRWSDSSTLDSRQSHQLAPGPVRTNRIRLHVYDLIAQETIMQLPWGINFPIGQCFNAVNSGLHTLGTGAYHVGIEINGIEYAYGANDTRGLTGVFSCMPKASPGYQYRTTIDLGDRALLRTIQPSRRGDESMAGRSRQRYVDGREIVREMALEYMGQHYDLLRKNCVTFAHDACLRLGVKEDEIPDWFRNLCVAGAAAQDAADAAHSTMLPLTRVFSACDMEGFAENLTGNGLEGAGNERNEDIAAATTA